MDKQTWITEAANALKDIKPVHLLIPPAEAFALVSQLQMALRHPNNRGITAIAAYWLARQLQTHLGQGKPAIHNLLAEGWKQVDVKFFQSGGGAGMLGDPIPKIIW